MNNAANAATNTTDAAFPFDFRMEHDAMYTEFTISPVTPQAQAWMNKIYSVISGVDTKGVTLHPQAFARAVTCIAREGMTVGSPIAPRYASGF